jgi:omega-6 fatty acid desaturase (delta-12 desaturase)
VAFLLLQRIPALNGAFKPRERNSVLWTNVCLLAILIAAGFTMGLDRFFLVQLPVVCLSTPLGVWLFYVQHQYEDAYWERHEGWDYVHAALYGSSFYQLPRIMQWFTGNIGFHHIHHLNPRIPNYRLEACHNENAVFAAVKPLTVRKSLKSLRISLWDEDRHKMVGYSEAWRQQPASNG